MSLTLLQITSGQNVVNASIQKREDRLNKHW